MKYRLAFYLLAIISVVLGITGCLGVSGRAGSAGTDVQTLAVEHSSCKSCHTFLEEDGRAVLLENVSPDELCASCHPDRKAPGEHRVGMLMDRARMNTTLPLVDGKVSCISCHEPHGLSGLGKLLRQAPERLCASCHLK